MITQNVQREGKQEGQTKHRTIGHTQKNSYILNACSLRSIREHRIQSMLPHMALTQEMWDQAITKGMLIWKKNGPSIDTSAAQATQPLPHIPINTAPIPPISQHLDPDLIIEPNIPGGPTSSHRFHHPLYQAVIPAVNQLSHESTTNHSSNHQSRRSSFSNPLQPNPSLGHKHLGPQQNPKYTGTTRYSTQ
jgi:hypothetical protein